MNSISHKVKTEEDLNKIYNEAPNAFRTWLCKTNLKSLKECSLLFDIKTKRMFIISTYHVKDKKDNIDTKCNNKFISTIKKHL